MISTISLFITVSCKVVRVHFLLKLKNHIATPFQPVTRIRHRFPSPRLPIFSRPAPWRAVQKRKSWQAPSLPPPVPIGVRT